MPEEPADALVVETVMPVVLEPVLSVLTGFEEAPAINEEPPFGLPALVFGIRCVWPGSVTVEVAVWVWLTTIALAEPPVSPTA